MASLSQKGLDINALIRELDALDADVIVPKMLEGAAPSLEQAMKNGASRHVRTGSMAASIKTGKVQKDGKGYHITVAPSGKDKNGMRNMEKMAYLEYGTNKQNATPVIAPAARESKAAVEAKLQEIFEKETEALAIK